MPAKSKYPLAVRNNLKEFLVSLSGEKPSVKNKNTYRHLLERILDNKDEYRIKSVWDFWCERTTPQKRNIANFYYWYKTMGGLTKRDVSMYSIYKNVLEKYEPNITITNEYFCNGAGDFLYEKLEKWSGKTGARLKEIIKDYFKICITDSFAKEKKLFLTARSYLTSWGWNRFMCYIEEQGGKENYIGMDAQEEEEYRIRTAKLSAIHLAIEAELLNGNLDTKAYQKLRRDKTKDLQELGLDKTYRKYVKNPDEYKKYL